MTLISNAKWNAFSQFFKVFVQLINIVYLAKIIPPNEYGIMAIATVFISFGMLLRDLGTATVIIQKAKVTDSLINSIFWINTGMGFSIFLLLIFSSPFISSLYNEQKLIPILIATSFIFPIASSSAVHLALMERHSRFKLVSIIEISSSILAMLTAVVMANNGYGVFSLVGQAIVLNVSTSLGFWWASEWRPFFKKYINKEDVIDIYSFTSNLFIFNLINYFSRNMDSFIIGKFMSTYILGCYSLAYRIMLFPLQSLTFVVSRSLLPVLSREIDTYKVLVTYKNCVFVIVFITMPLMSMLAFLSDEVITFVFGSNWLLTASILKWLAPTAIVQSILSTTGAVFSSKGRTDLLLKLGIFNTIILVSSFVIGAQGSIVFFSKMYFIANIICFFPSMFFLMRLIGGSVFELLKYISSILLSTLLMLGVLYYLSNYLLYAIPISNVKMIFLFSSVGLFIYVLSMYIFSPLFRLLILKKLRYL